MSVTPPPDHQFPPPRPPGAALRPPIAKPDAAAVNVARQACDATKTTHRHAHRWTPESAWVSPGGVVSNGQPSLASCCVHSRSVWRNELCSRTLTKRTKEEANGHTATRHALKSNFKNLAVVQTRHRPGINNVLVHGWHDHRSAMRS